MSELEKALVVSNLTRIIVDMQEKKERLKQLNKYDHSDSCQPFFVEIGGGGTHIKYYPKDNELGDSITVFFTEIFSKLEANAEKALSELLK